jgi:hypothetical protein
MTKPTNHVDLAQGIERLVREYISTIHASAQQAVDLAFGAGASGNTATSAKRRASAISSPPSHAGKRRASDEIGTLSERLYEALCRTPGETMTVLAPIVGASARELHRPMTVLKRAGRIRSVGTRYATRYFPMAPRPSA